MQVFFQIKSAFAKFTPSAGEFTDKKTAVPGIFRDTAGFLIEIQFISSMCETYSRERSASMISLCSLYFFSSGLWMVMEIE